MDVTYEEYMDFVIHLYMQEFLDFSYHFGKSESTVDSLAIV
jgi:hypothetical protein